MSRDDRRVTVLAEATRIIGEYGYRSFSLSELARRCGLTNAGLLYHFGSKQRLLIALLEQRDHDDRAAIEASVGRRLVEPECDRAGVLAALHAIVCRNVGQPELVRLFTVLRAEALLDNHPAYTFFREREARTHTLLATMVTGLVADPEDTSRQITAMMAGLETQWLGSDCAFDLIAAWADAAAKIIPQPRSGDFK